MKKYYYVIIIGIVIISMFSFVFVQTSDKNLSEVLTNNHKISKIIIRNGNNGKEYNFSNLAQITEIINLFKQVNIKRQLLYEESTGNSYIMNFYYDDDKSLGISIVSSNLYIDGKKYIADKDLRNIIDEFINKHLK